MFQLPDAETVSLKEVVLVVVITVDIAGVGTAELEI